MGAKLGGWEEVEGIGIIQEMAGYDALQEFTI
jgi:hypothetical protein